MIINHMAQYVDIILHKVYDKLAAIHLPVAINVLSNYNHY